LTKIIVWVIIIVSETLASAFLRRYGMKKKRKKIYIMYAAGLFFAALALGAVILTTALSGNKIMSVIFGDTEDISSDADPDNTGGNVSAAVTADGGDETLTSINYSDVKAMWLSQFDLNSVYTQSGRQRSQRSFESLMRTVLDNVANNGINTIFVQMRPYADSMYPSEYYPASSYAAGAYGREFTYDPIEIIVKMAHERGLSVHAWINPMRGMLEKDVAAVDTKYKIRQWYDSAETNGKYVVTVDGRLYLNPA